ncbi:hypothetical protein [Streptomyces sp. NPDC012510]|uniref:hypothetical protein n=1 Tax=Streptomyces sp. NPDC012510 TaxID=3364838 RepID=UPI0036E2CB30
MSLWSRIREHTGGRSPGSSKAADQHSTTGTTPNETFVGRVAGNDPGYLETGAEERAEADAGRDESTRPDRP